MAIKMKLTRKLRKQAKKTMRRIKNDKKAKAYYAMR